MVSHEEPLEVTVAVWLGVAVAIMAAISTSHARDLMSLEPGTEIEKVASIGNKQVPLPDGRWEVVISEADRRGSVKTGNAFLARKAKGRLAAHLFVRTNLEIGSGTGWKRPRWCDRNNVHHNGSDSAGGELPDGNEPGLVLDNLWWQFGHGARSLGISGLAAIVVLAAHLVEPGHMSCRTTSVAIRTPMTALASSDARAMNPRRTASEPSWTVP